MLGLIAGVFVLCMSVITFALYAVDKRRAIEGRWRIAEATLLGCSILGGAIGGFLAMQLVRHKTKRWYFKAVNIAFGIAHILLVIWLVTV